MKGIRQLFGQIWQRSIFALVAVLMVAGQLIVAVPVAHAAPGTLSGKVTAGPTNQPVASATVDVLQHQTTTVLETDDTDANGDYAIDIETGTYDLRITPPAASGYTVSTIKDVQVTTNTVYNVVLLPTTPVPDTYTYSGYLLDQDGAPVVGALVALTANQIAGEDATGGDGFFSITAPTGQYRIFVRNAISGNFSNIIGASNVVNLTSNISQNLTVRTVELTFDVRDQNGDPVNHVRGEASQESGFSVPGQIEQFLPGYLSNFDIISNNQSSETSNTVKMRVLSGTTGLAEVQDVAQNFQPKRFTFPAMTTDTTTQVTLDPKPIERTFSGTLRDQDGDPLPGVRIVLGGGGNTTTNSSGFFSLTAVPGTYPLIVSGFTRELSNLRTLNQVVDLTTQDVSLDLTLHLVKLTIEVQDQNGDPIQDVEGFMDQISDASDPEHFVEQPLPGELSSYDIADRMRNQSGNQIELALLPGAPIADIIVTTPGDDTYQTYSLSHQPAITADTHMVIHMVKKPVPHTVTGILRDQNGAPISGVSVLVGGVRSTTDGNGFYSITAPPGVHPIGISGFSNNFSAMHGQLPIIDLTTADTTQDLVLRRVKFTVHVQDTTGSPITNVNGNVTQDSITGSSSSNPHTIEELIPGYQMVYDTFYTASNEQGSSLEFDILPGAPIDALIVGSNSSDFNQVHLSNIAAPTQDTAMAIQLQRRNPPQPPENVDADSPTTMPHVTWNASNGATSYKVFRNGAEVATINTLSYIDETPGQDGTYEYAVKACNEAGCSVLSSVATVSLDTTGPTVTNAALSSNPVIQGATTTLTFDASDPNGVAAAEYSPYQPLGDPGEEFPMDQNGNTFSATFGNDLPVGNRFVYYRAKDALGNWGPMLTLPFSVISPDSSPPVITYNLNPTLPASGWFVTPVTLTWSVTDAQSAVTNQTDCGTVIVNSSTSGAVYTCTATSAGGTSSNSLTIKYDDVAPAVGDATWTANPLNVGQNTQLSVGVTDALSGVQAAEYFVGSTDPGAGNATAMTLSGGSAQATLGAALPIGTHTINVRSRDVAGNWSAPKPFSLVVQDVAAPNVSAILSAQANANGWHKTDVVIDWQSVDPAPSSGTPTDPPNTTASTEGANVTYTSAQSCDPAGNCATGSVQISLDKTVPTTTGLTTPRTAMFRVMMPAISATATDALSGVQRGEYYFDTDPGQGNGTTMTYNGTTINATIPANAPFGPHTLYVRSLDHAGNWSIPVSKFVVLL